VNFFAFSARGFSYGERRDCQRLFQPGKMNVIMSPHPFRIAQKDGVGERQSQGKLGPNGEPKAG